MAILLDGTILAAAWFMVLLIIGAILAGVSNSHSSSSSNHSSGGAVFLGFFFLFGFVSFVNAFYYAAMNGSRRGQTLGKMALGIAVRDSRSGGRIGFWRGFGRAVVMCVFYILLFVPYVLDNLAPLWSARRQAWHDHVAQSIVVDLRP